MVVVYPRRSPRLEQVENRCVLSIMFHPFHFLQVKVADRTAVTTSNAETVVVKPSHLQEAINTETGEYFILTDTIFLFPFTLNHLVPPRSCTLLWDIY